MLIGLAGGLGVFFLLTLLLSWPWWAAGLTAAGVYAGLFLLTKPRLKIGNIRADSLPDGDELKRLMSDAEEDMAAISRAGQKIRHPRIRAESQKLYQTGVKILEYLENHPERISAARRFFTYYLDTAVEILEKYLPFQASGLQTEEVLALKASTEKAMLILNEAFEKQFTNLMRNDILDIETDIKVLEVNLRSEGK